LSSNVKRIATVSDRFSKWGEVMGFQDLMEFKGYIFKQIV